MRIAEKTIELNFCAQAAGVAKGVRLIWFGLTQKQEARFGFDACTKLGGRLFIFQFKASNFVLKNGGARRFYAAHQQMVRLQKQCKRKRSVFYVFPLVGTTLELSKQPDLLSVTRLIDVAGLPSPMPPPTKSDGTLRKSGIHYVDVSPSGAAVIHSEPQNVAMISSKELFETGVADAPGLLRDFSNGFERFWEFRNVVGRSAVGLIALPE